MIPPDTVVVPREPTEEMCLQGEKAGMAYFADAPGDMVLKQCRPFLTAAIYRAMLAAAPASPAPQEAVAWGEKPVGSFGAGFSSLLDEINAYAHAPGTNGAMRDLLKRLHRYVRTHPAPSVSPSVSVDGNLLLNLQATLATMKSAHRQGVHMAIWERDIECVEKAAQSIAALFEGGE